MHAAETILDTSLELFIFSGLSAAKRLSGGEFRKIYHFDAKAEMVEYLEARNPRLAERTAVLQLGMFLTNTRAPSPLRATKVGLCVEYMPGLGEEVTGDRVYCSKQVGDTVF